jgi:pimeloyl-ACP methyl ester carboxylesterase
MRDPVSSAQETAPMTETANRSGYAPVNGLQLYYEIHGEGGTPLVLVHGAHMNIDFNWAELLPTLATTRQVIALESQGHGRTADIDRPITYQAMADDVAAVLDYLSVPQADVFGFSMGAGIALDFAIRYPGKVRKAVLAAITYRTDGMHPELLPMFHRQTPATFASTRFESEYLRLAPNPDDFPVLVNKLTTLYTTPQNWLADDVRSISAPTLLIFGDADIARLEHVVEMFRLLGGGVCGDFVPIPAAHLAILPGTSRLGMLERSDMLMALVQPFLDAPMPEPDQANLAG